MSTAWKNLGQMGGVKCMIVMRWLSLKLGRRYSRPFLYLILFYYYLLSFKGRRYSRDFLKRALPRRVTQKDICKHFLAFASMLHDRVYLASGAFDQLSFEVKNADSAFDKIKKKQGFFMLGSHLGSFDVLRCLAQDVGELPLKLLMDTGSTEQFNRLLYAINPNVTQSIIDATRGESVFEVDQALRDGYMVGVLGDRVMTEQRVVTCDFFGEKVKFPGNPILLASLMKVPVVLFFGVYLGGNRYRIIFELFAEKIEINRNNRDEEVAEWVQKYVNRLEYYAKKYPYNWFNLYDYWQ